MQNACYFLQLQTSIFSTDFNKTPKFKKFTKNRPVGGSCSMLTGARETDMAMPTVAFSTLKMHLN